MGIQQLLLASGFSQVVHTYTTGTSVTETVPIGASRVSISVISPGAGGGGAAIGGPVGGGGGGGLAVSNNIACTGGQTLVYTLGVPGVGTANISGTNGTASSVVSGTLSITTMSGGIAVGGQSQVAGGAGGAGATATGGTTSNTAGATGASGNPGAGGNSGNGNSGVPGGGGAGQIGGGTPSSGFAGQIQFTYT